jgi:hypothetical protein
LKPAAGAITFTVGPEHGPQDANTMSRVWAIGTAVSGPGDRLSNRDRPSAFLMALRE